jgi:lipopolysaccharide/colanic/teichoic acid biosynthesis glycosyltransferase
MSKRLFDILLAGAGLLLLAPLLLLLAAWIKWDSPGPVLYMQQRVGCHGRLFNIIKFRTMQCREEEGAQITVGKDSRITPAGHVLRHYKLDELPQLINVLLGSMSMVGPRPEVPRYVACYPPDMRALVLSVAPGITDWAAIEYKDENALLAGASDPERTYIDEILPAKLRHYAHYVHERSFVMDLHILYRTLAAIVIR